MTNEYIHTEAKYTALSDAETDSPVTVSGVALGEGDITRGASGKATLWPRETLEPAADGLQGQPIATDENHDTDAQPQTPTTAVIGENTWSGYKPGVGVLYEGELDDSDVARSVENGRLEVSPLVARDVEPLEGDLAEEYAEKGYDVEAAEYVATEIHGWRDLAAVVSGAAPSNEISVGGQELKAEALAEALSDAQGGFDALKEVAGVEFTGTASGSLDESEIPTDAFQSHYLYPGDTKSESSYPVVDAGGDLRRGNVDAAHQLGARGGVDESDFSGKLDVLAGEFENPPAWAGDSEAMAAVMGVDSSDDPSGASTSGADNDGETDTMSETENDLSETEVAVLQAAESVEEPVEALNEIAGVEDATVVESSEYESLSEQVDTAKSLYADALSERWDTSEEKIRESFTLEALREEFEDDDGNLNTEALVQNPETGQPDEEPENGVEALSEDADVEKAEALYSDYQTFGTEGLKADITDALGVSDFDEATEVLD